MGATTPTTATPQPKQIVVVDWTVTDYQALIAGIDPTIPVIVLQPGEDGLSGLAQVLGGYQELDAIHLVTHGWGGALRFGGQTVTDYTLRAQADEVRAIGDALRAGGDLMLYGCSVASGTAGQRFVDDLASMLGDVTVAASTDDTGPGRLGGDWELEWSSGEVETALPFTARGMEDMGQALGVPTAGQFIVGDGSGGGGGGGSRYTGISHVGGAGGAGGGDADTLIGGAGNDLIIGDGSGGGGGAADDTGGEAFGGAAGSGNDSLMGGAGNDILVGDGWAGRSNREGYEGAADKSVFGGAGGFGGGGGGGTAFSYVTDTNYFPTAGAGGLGAGGGGGAGGAYSSFGANGGAAGGIGGGGGGGGGPKGPNGEGSLGTNGAAGTLLSGGAGGTAGYNATGGGGGGYFGTGGVGSGGNGGNGAHSSTGAGNGGKGGLQAGSPFGSGGGGGLSMDAGTGTGGNGATVTQNSAATAGSAGGTSAITITDTNGAFYNKAWTSIATLRSDWTLGSGADTLDGGAGDDQYYGLGGADVFVFDLADHTTNTDTVWDYKKGESDVLRLLVDGASISSSDFAALTKTYSGGDTTITFVDADAAGKTLSIVLKGVQIADITLDTTGAVEGGSGPVISGLEGDNDLLTNDFTPTVIGTAEAGSTVVLYEGGIVWGTVAADAVTGAWTATTGSLADGLHTLTARSISGGSTSTASAPLTVTIDTTASTSLAIDPANSSPADNATGVALTAKPVIDFSANIQFGTSGTITLYDITHGRTVQSWDVADATQRGTGDGQISISGDKLTIDPLGRLTQGTEYAVRFSAGSIQDTAATPESLSAVSDNTTYNFKTVTPADGVGDNLYFVASDGTNGQELWAYNSTTGKSAMLGDTIRPGTASFLNTLGFNLALYHGDLYLAGNDGVSYTSGGVGSELYRFDGASFTLAADLRPGVGTNGTTAISSTPVVRGLAGDKLIVSSSVITPSNATNQPDLFIYDGTSFTSVDLDPTNSSGTAPLQTALVYVAVGDAIWFQAAATVNSTTSTYLQKLDAGGTVTVTDQNQLQQSFMVTDGTNLYYFSNSGNEVRRYNTLTGVATTLASNEWHTQGPPAELAYHDGKLYYTAEAGKNQYGTNYEMIVYDIASSTRTVKEITTGSTGADPRGYTFVGDTAYFTVYDTATSKHDIWKYDTTTDTLTKAVSGATTESWQSNSRNITIYDGKIYYRGVLPATGAELYVFDPADDSVSLVKDVNLGTATADAKLPIVIDDVDLAPLLRGLPGSAVSHVAASAAVTVVPSMTVVDVDSPSVTGATVSIGGFTTGDVLGFTLSGGITGSYNSATGVLSLTGDAADSVYQTVLRSVTFSAAAVGSGTRTLSFTMTDGIVASAVSTATVAVTATPNTAPVLALVNTDLSYGLSSAAVQIDAAGTVSDADGDVDWNGGKLEVQITAGNQSNDRISIADTDGDGTVVTINGTEILVNGTDIGDLSTSGGTVTNGNKLTITFDGDATNAYVQEVLQSLRFSSTGTAANRTVTVTATDRTGASASDTRVIAAAVDNTPAAPSGLLLATASDTGALDGRYTADTTPSITGSAAAAGVVTLYEGGTLLGTATLAGAGAWTITPATTMSSGDHSLTTRIVAAGGTSPVSGLLTVTIDTAAPSVPAGLLLAPASDTGVQEGRYTADTTPTITGSAEANSIVMLYDSNGTTVLGSATADGSGLWTVTTGTLIAGDHSLTVKVVDRAGNTSGASTALTVTIDTVAPATPDAPVLETNSDSGVKEGRYTSDITPTIIGTAEADSIVTLYEGGAAIGTVVADGSGQWTLTTGTLGSGDHSLTVRAVDRAGNSSAASTALTVTIDTSAPATPDAPVLETNSDSGTKDGRYTSDTTPTIIGTAEANSTVTLYEGGVAIGTAVADGSGRWTVTTGTLGSGDHSLTARAVDRAGNSSGASTALTVTIDTVAPSTPAAPLLDPDSDSGVKEGRYTSDTTPTVTGTVEANSIVTLYEGAVAIGTVLADGSGRWSLTTGTLGTGDHSLTVRAVDPAGNTSGASSALTITIDSSAPSTPAAPVLDPDSDTGPKEGHTTADTTPTITGSAEANSTVILYDGGAAVGTAVAGGSGLWTVTTGVLSEGGHTLAVRAVDQAGNTSGASTALTVTIDTSAPAAPVLDPDSDTGAKDGRYTADTTPTIFGTAQANSTVTLYDGSVVAGTVTADADGLWTITTGSLGAGDHSLTVTAVDTNGDTSLASSALTITIDTSAPAAPAAPALEAGSDSGTKEGRYTSDTTPTITGSAEANSTVTLYDGAVAVGTAVADGNGLWTITTGTLDERDHSLTARAVDAAGNTSGASSVLTITIDLSGPGTPAMPVLEAGSDSGIKDGRYTSDDTPAISGSAEANSIVTLYDTNGTTPLGTAVADGSGLWTVTTGTLDPGDHSLTVKAVDAAGNTSGASAALTITIDSSAPSTPDAPVLTSGSDSGAAEGHYTRVTTPAISGSAEADSIVILYDGGLAVGTAVADGSGLWTITTGTLGESTHSLTVKAVDAAGNTSGASAALTLTIDLSGPATPDAPALATGSDTGVKEGHHTSLTTPTITGSAEADSIVILYDGGLAVGTAVADGSGLWTITTGTLGESTHSLTVTAVDRAGNMSGASTALTLTIDLTGPSAPATPVLTSGSDSGLKDGRYTNDDTPAISGSAEAFSTVTLYDTDGATLLGTAVADASGLWTVTTGTLGTGDHSLTVTAVDRAGNTSAASSALTLTIDADAPDTPGAPFLDPLSDSGPAEGRYTNDTTPTIGGTAEAYATITLHGGGVPVGTAVADGSGHWSLTTGTLGEGDHSLTVTAVDRAGNTSGVSSIFTLTIDTSTPSTPDAPLLETGSDSGAKDSRYTSVTTPSIIGTAEAYSIVTLYEGGTVLGTAVADGSGLWTVTTGTLGEGDHGLTVRTADRAGNTSGSSAALTVTIDTATPAAPGGLLLDPYSDSGLAGDNRTRDDTPEIRGTAEAGSLVTLYDGVTVLGTAYADGAGHWSIVSSHLGDGAHSLTTRSVDAAGHTSATSATLTLTIDAIAPAAPAGLHLTAASDGGTADGRYTNHISPTIAGTAEANATIILYDGATALGTVAADGTGLWSITAASLAAGDRTLRAEAIDAAGNSSGGSSELTVTIDTVAPSLLSAVVNGDRLILTYDGPLAGGFDPAGHDYVVKVGGTTATVSHVDAQGSTVTLLLASPVTRSQTVTLGYTVPGLNPVQDDAGNKAAALGNQAVTNLTPNYRTPTISPFHLPDVGENAAPALVDIDGDGDFDAVIGTKDGNTLVFRNIGSPGTPNFSLFGTNAFGLADIGDNATPVLADIDGDGDLDAFIGGADGNTRVFINVGTSSAPSFSLLGTNSFGLGNVLADATPVLADIDGDGDLDAFIGGADGNTRVFINTGTSASPSFSLLGTNGFGLGNVGTEAAPTLIDIDNDGDLDAFIGNGDGKLVFFRNVGSSTAPTFSLSATNPYSLADVGDWAKPVFADLDADGDPDALVGNAAGLLNHFLNATPLPPPPPPPVVPTSTETVDGVTVGKGTQTNSDGTTSTVVTIPIVTETRNEQVGGNTVADIPLVKTSGGGSLLTAQVPAGLGLQVSGSSTPKTAADSLTDLIREIRAHTEAGSNDQTVLTGGGSGFLSDIPADTPLLVQTIIPTAPAGGTASTEPLVITGTPTAAGNPYTALVIDTRGLPSGTTIQLQNVEFAAVIGAVRVTGGEGSQNVWGDGDAQYIVLGADDDTLHGGGGDDYVGSRTGNDLLYGDGGADTVTGGEEDDIVYGNRQDDMVYGNTGSDTLYGGQDQDVAFGGRDDDLVYGNRGNDAIYGNLGNDTLFGGQAEDLLFGGRGDDVLFGKTGDDTLTGGTGADSFVFQAGSGGDLITDFSFADGDRLLVTDGRGWTVSDGGTGAIIDFGSGDQVTLADIRADQVSSAWFRTG